MKNKKMAHRVRGLTLYYERIFDRSALDTIIDLLATCSGEFALEQREFALCLQNADGEQFFSRQLVLRNASEVRQVIRYPTEYQQRGAGRNGPALCSLSFGPIFPGLHLADQPMFPPKLWPQGGNNRFSAKPREMERSHAMKQGNACGYGEMVLDVDLDHDPADPDKYDRTNVCACGKARKVCDACWSTFMDPAQRVLLWVLREFLGYRRIFTVFSGRRGFHMWICDERVIRMSQPERRSLVEVLRRPTLGEGDELSDHIYTILAPVFDNTPALRARFHAPPLERDWKDAHRAAVFAALWPKLDVAVSADVRHLHKVPLVLHPSTGAICVVMGDVDDDEERFVPSQDTFYVHEVDASLLYDVVHGCAQEIRRALNTTTV